VGGENGWLMVKSGGMWSKWVVGGWNRQLVVKTGEAK